jgi:predicted transcriptional regulator
VAQLALYGKSEMVQLKAIEVLNKMQGYNSPDSVRHSHVHLQVNAALIEELRSGYAELSKRSAKVCLPLQGGAGAGGR